MLNIHISDFTERSRSWTWKSRAGVTQHTFTSPYIVGTVVCEKTGLKYTVTGVPARPKQGRGYVYFPDEERVFINRYADTPNYVLARCFGRTVQDIENKAKQLGLMGTKNASVARAASDLRNPTKSDRWTPQEDMYLRTAWALNNTYQEIADVLGKTRGAVVKRRQRLGLRPRN